jgi:hypothetical protein
MAHQWSFFMNILLISRPGISLMRTLRESETAWDAIRFYGPIGTNIGVFIPVPSLAGAISLASDLRFFIRKYTTEHLFQMGPGFFCTSALTKNLYLTRDHDFSDKWTYRLIYWIENGGKVNRYRKENWNSEEVLYNSFIELPVFNDTNQDEASKSVLQMNSPDLYDKIPGGYLLEVWSTKPEYELI